MSRHGYLKTVLDMICLNPSFDPLPSTDTAAVITGTGWRRGGGACGARPTGGLAARASGRPQERCRAAERPGVDDAPKRPPVPHYDGAVAVKPLDAPVRQSAMGPRQ